jgi:hypothetical protein
VIITGKPGSDGPTSEKGAPAALVGIFASISNRSKHGVPIRAKSMARIH